MSARDKATESATISVSSPSSNLFTDYLNRDRFGSLDGLRCLCILAVLWHHGPVWTTMSDPPLLLTRGFLGVDFFFVLSGFLITTLLLREAAQTGHFSLREFYRKRFLRIVPVYVLLVTVVSAYFILAKGQVQYVELVPYYYLFLANFLPSHIPLLAPMWSLSVEEQYYLIWPLLLIILPKRAVLPVLALLIALNVAGAMGVLASFGVQAFAIGPLHIALPNPTYAPILLGSALAVCLRQQRGFFVLSRLFGRREASCLLILALGILMVLLPQDLSGLPNLAIHLLMTACLASLVLREDHVLALGLSWRPVARVGEISYGIYLYHLIGLHLATQLLPLLGITASWVVLIAYAAISILIAEISYRTFEAWFRRFRHRPRPVQAVQ